MTDFTMINGHDFAGDPGGAQLRRYLPVLAVIAAPYADPGGDQDPINPLDRVGEWQRLVEAAAEAARLQAGHGAPLALVRLAPPTASRLGEALSASGPDAFRVVHLVAHGERDLLYLEDEDGHEAYAVAELITRLLKTSGVRLVVMQGCFNQRMAQMVIDETPVEAVIGTRRQVQPASAALFTAHLYARLAGGASVPEAFRAAVAALETLPDGQADRFELLTGGELVEAAIPLPAPDARAPRPLVCDGLPRTVDLPVQAEFVGRRDMLAMLARDIPAGYMRAAVIAGPAGLGKSWLAAEFAGRFGWRFPGGVLWIRCTVQTTAREVIAAVARLLELPLYAPPDAVQAALNRQGMLIVLDGADSLLSMVEAENLSQFFEGIQPDSGSRVIITARQTAGPLASTEETRFYRLEPFAYKAARTLAMRLAVERRLDTLDVDTIDDFLERTLSLPWLIVRGIAMVQDEGIAAALDELAAFTPDLPDPLGAFYVRRLQALEDEPGNPALVLLKFAQGLTDAFDLGLAEGLVGDVAPELVANLQHTGLLIPAGDLNIIPLPVLAYMRQHHALTPDERDQSDEFILDYLANHWPDGAAQPWLNNVRGVLRRQVRPRSALAPAQLAAALGAAAPSFGAAGLAEEFLAYADAIRAQLNSDPDLAALQIAMGNMLALLPGHQSEAGWTFQVTLTLERLDPVTRAKASLAYGQHLVAVGEAGEAVKLLGSVLRPVLMIRPPDVALAAAVAHDWAKALAAAGQHADSVARYEGALAGYAEIRRADLSVAAHGDLAESLVALGDLDRAEDLLRRAVASADQIGRADLAGQIRQQLASIHTARAEWPAAARCLSDALIDRLPAAGSAALAALYQDFARVLARVSRLDDAAAHADRSRRLWERLDRPADQAVAWVALGQFRMASGDAAAAQTALHAALDLVPPDDTRDTRAMAAGLLVRLHQMRARRATTPAARQSALEQALISREGLSAAGLADYAAALDPVIRTLGGP